jgi:hypothetical protein
VSNTLAALEGQQVGDQIIDLLLRQRLPLAAIHNALLVTAEQEGVGVNDHGSQIHVGRLTGDCATGAIADIGAALATAGVHARLDRVAREARDARVGQGYLAVEQP